MINRMDYIRHGVGKGVTIRFFMDNYDTMKMWDIDEDAMLQLLELMKQLQLELDEEK